MTDPMSRHYGEELQDLLDERLSEPLRGEVEAHVETCGRCKRELDALRWVKTRMPKLTSDPPIPADLAQRLNEALNAEGRSRGVTGVTGSTGVTMSRGRWIAAALAAAAVVMFVLLYVNRSPEFVSLVAEDFATYQSGTDKLAIESRDPKVVERYFVENGIDFETHVFDLGMMSYQLAGGRVTRLDGRPSAMFAYRGQGDISLVCQMYEGKVDELPPTSDVRQHNGITFHVYRVQNLTLVFWQEGDVVCVLASDANQEDVVQLAFAKAVPGRRPSG
jgi:anti-sigma factor RsiW